MLGRLRKVTLDFSIVLAVKSQLLCLLVKHRGATSLNEDDPASRLRAGK